MNLSGKSLPFETPRRHSAKRRALPHAQPKLIGLLVVVFLLIGGLFALDRAVHGNDLATGISTALLASNVRHDGRLAFFACTERLLLQSKMSGPTPLVRASPSMSGKSHNS